VVAREVPRMLVPDPVSRAAIEPLIIDMVETIERSEKS
jgi:hypothetical protein